MKVIGYEDFYLSILYERRGTRIIEAKRKDNQFTGYKMW